VLVQAGGKLTAYVGGIESNKDRILPVSKGAPLFDISVRLVDAAAWRILQTFLKRWNQLPPAFAVPPLRGATVPEPPHAGPLLVQVTHTYGRDFPFAKVAVTTSASAIANGIRNARRYIYIEDQYCVGSPAMRSALQDALTSTDFPNLVVIFVIAAEDSVADLPDLPFRRREFFRFLLGIAPDRVLIFERLGAGSPTGPTAYVHSKLVIVDDDAAFIGSVNSSRRSWSHDSEVDATLVDRGGATVRDFRSELWARHLVVLSAPALADPNVGIAIWKAIATVGRVGVSVRRYDVFAVPVRLPLPDAVLNKYWDFLADPP
jgi:phosphatidylserine/phosphatidylglycerophosphate/cardiolipin synthase-like enzyme